MFETFDRNPNTTSFNFTEMSLSLELTIFVFKISFAIVPQLSEITENTCHAEGSLSFGS